MKYLVTLLIFIIVFVAVAFAPGVPEVGDSEQYAPRIPAYTWAEMRAIGEHAEGTEEKARGVFRFHDRLQAVKADLRTGTISLAEATDSLHAAAARDNPAFLKSLACERPDSPLREKFALVLLGHLREELRTGATSSIETRILEKLYAELAAWPGVSPYTLDALCEKADDLTDSGTMSPPGVPKTPPRAEATDLPRLSRSRRMSTAAR